MEEYVAHTPTPTKYFIHLSQNILWTHEWVIVYLHALYMQRVCVCVRASGSVGENEWWVIRNPWGFPAGLSFLPHVTACWGKHPAHKPYSQTTSTLHLKRTLNLQRGKDCAEINPHLLCNLVPINAAVWFKIKYTVYYYNFQYKFYIKFHITKLNQDIFKLYSVFIYEGDKTVCI